LKVPYEGKLVIFTSFYSHTAYAPYVISLAQTLEVLAKCGINHEYMARPSDFHIERAINNTLTELMDSDVTDILLIDSDESWKPEDVVRLLLHPEEIVGCSYRMKNKWDEYVGVITYEDGFPQGKMLSDGTPLLKADRVAAGFLRIKVSALKKWAAAYPELVSEESDGNKIQFFSRMLCDGEMFCQDMAFSKRWKDIGGELWIDPNINITHWGFEPHQGDMNGYLKAKHTPKTDIKKSFEIISEMAKEIYFKHEEKELMPIPV
jgi:hypothetical protein